jgi:hypothetical protein
MRLIQKGFLFCVVCLLLGSYFQPNPTSAASTFDLITLANQATWTSGSGTLPFPGSESDAKGFALWRDKAKLEDGSTPSRVLETHPEWKTDGWIAGTYAPVTVPANATMTIALGFLDGATGSDGALFVVEARSEADKAFTTLLEKHAKYDGTLDTASIGLGAWSGKSVIFRLTVKAGKSASQDWAAWSKVLVEAKDTAPVITTTCPLTAGQINQSYSVGLTATGGTPPYHWVIKNGALPAGLSLNAEKGEISGTPNVVGRFDFDLQVYDSHQALSPLTDCEMEVREGPVPSTPAPFDVSISASPRDITLNLDPLIDRTATQVEASFTVQVSLLSGTPRSVSLQMTDLPPHVSGYCTDTSGTPPFSTTCILSVASGTPLPELTTSRPIPIWVLDGSSYLHNAGVYLTITQTERGDLSVLALDPVQVLYSTSDPLASIPLIKDKATLFRAVVYSTFTEETSIYVRLTLPPDQWDTLPPSTGHVISGVPSGYAYPVEFGPYAITPGENTLILPLINPGMEQELWDPVRQPSGIIRGQCVGAICGLDVRVVPRPQVLGLVNYAVAVDSRGSLEETNESNNAKSGETEVRGSRPWRFYFIPFKSNGANCSPDTNFAANGAKGMLEYMLATFPIAESEIEYAMAPFTTITACTSGTGALCGYNTVWEDRDSSYAGFEERWQFLTRIARMARSEGYDIAIGLGCGGGGGTGGSDSAFFIGDCGGNACDVLAHEFMHLTSGMGDIYSLDCLVGWDESYCEHADGSRTYCCYIDEARHDGYLGQICTQDVGNITRCTPNYEKECSVSCDCSIYAERANDYPACSTAPVCDAGCCQTRCAATCAGGTLYGGPDGRIVHPTTDGFWVNRYIPTGVKTYFMDTATMPGWVFPARWMRSLPTSSHCSGDIFNDGYINLVYNRRFADLVDPRVVLVSGTITRDGKATLDPALQLGDMTTDAITEGTGEFEVHVHDASGQVLSKAILNPIFTQSDPAGGAIDQTGFSVRMEWKDTATAIEVVNSAGEVLATREVSAHAPEVKLTSPQVDSTFNPASNVQITWEGKDDDKDELTYFLSLSPDNGETWVPIAADITSNTFDLSGQGLSEGDAYRIRVRLSDGILTGEDEMDGAFAISATTPVDDGKGTPEKEPWHLKNILLPALAGAGVLLLIIIIVIMVSRRK